MAKFMDVHSGFFGVTEAQLKEAHEADLAIEGEEGVHFERRLARSRGAARCSACRPDRRANRSCASTSARAIRPPKSTNSRSRWSEMNELTPTRRPAPRPCVRHPGRGPRRRRPARARSRRSPPRRRRVARGRPRGDRRLPRPRRRPRRRLRQVLRLHRQRDSRTSARWASTTCSGALVGDPAIDPLRPEVLMYAPNARWRVDARRRRVRRPPGRLGRGHPGDAIPTVLGTAAQGGRCAATGTGCRRSSSATSGCGATTRRGCSRTGTRR